LKDEKHWLDWLAVGMSLFSLVISSFAAYRSIFFQRDDIRLVVGEALKITRDSRGLLLAEDHEFTLINSGNRPAAVSEIYGELVLVIDPKAALTRSSSGNVNLRHAMLPFFE
jgi:hypothetical protein